MGNWSLTLNVAGVGEFTPGAFARIATGPYQVQILDTDREQKDPSKAPSYRFDVQITEPGDFAGIKTRVYVGGDLTKDGNRKHWRSLLLGVGANPTALEGGNITIDQSAFIGKPAFIYVEEAPEGATRADGKREYDNRNFVSPTFYEKSKMERAQGAAQGGLANAQSHTGAAAGVNGGAPQPSGLANLAGALGGNAQQGGVQQGGQATSGGALFNR